MRAITFPRSARWAGVPCNAVALEFASRLTRAVDWLSARPLVVALAYVAAGLLVYAPALNGSPIWDDLCLVGDNPFFRSPIFAFEAFRHYLFFDSFSTYYRPVQNWSYMWDYWLWRGEPVGYHLSNVLLHSACGFLLYRLLRHLLADLPAARRIALVVSLLWLVHPIHNAAVAYISGRADSLAMFFALSAWLMARRAAEDRALWRRVAFSFGASCSALLALCSKEIALMWLVLFLVQLFFGKRKPSVRARLGTLAGVLAVFSVYAWLHSLPATRAAVEGPVPTPMAERVMLMLRALGDYTGLIFFPAHLQMERMLSHPASLVSATGWRTYAGYEWLGIIGLLAAIAGVLLCRLKAPGRWLRTTGAAWFVIAFLPISNLFPLNAEVAEHWIYLASIGYLLFLAGCFLALPAQWQRWASCAVAVAAVALGVRTAVRSFDWVNGETFYQRTMASGGVTPRIVISLAAIYGREGDLPRQEQLLRKGLQHFPAYTPIRINLGVCLTRQGRAQEAQALLKATPETADQTARRFPHTWPAALGLARLRFEANDPDAALQVLAEAAKRFPETWELVKYENELRQQIPGATSALPAIERYAAAHWWHCDSWLTLADLYVAIGAKEKAISVLQHASRLDLYDPKPYAAIAQLERQRAHPGAALDAQFAAIARAPGQPSLYLGLAGILQELGRDIEAGAAIDQAQRLVLAAGKL